MATDIVLCGPQGSGKSFLARILAEKYKFIFNTTARLVLNEPMDIPERDSILIIDECTLDDLECLFGDHRPSFRFLRTEKVIYMTQEDIPFDFKRDYGATILKCNFKRSELCNGKNYLV